VEELARRRHKLPPRPRVLWADLAEPRRDGARVWLVLAEGEQWPVTLESVENRRVVWSSLWASRPDDRIVLEISGDGGDGSTLEFTWLAAPPLPGHASAFRYRLNQLFAQELRYSYGQ
jgi:hypothetical protein